MMEEPLQTLNLMDTLTGGESHCPSIASSIRSIIDPLEHHRLLCLEASSWWQPSSTTKKRKRKEPIQAEEESAPPINHPKFQKLVLNDHHNNREQRETTGLVDGHNDNENCLGLSLGVSPRPAHDDQLDQEIRGNQVAEEDDDDDSLLRLSLGSSYVRHHCDQIRPAVHRSDPALFNIRKKLKSSDIGHLSRLLLPKELVKSHILPNFNENLLNKINSEKGLKVVVFDEDRQEKYQLIFKYLKSSRSYYFNRKWTKHFVKVLNLKEDDEIGLYLDTTILSSPEPWFHFSLLKLARQADEVAPAV